MPIDSPPTHLPYLLTYLLTYLLRGLSPQNELYRPSDRRMSAKLVPTSVDSLTFSFLHPNIKRTIFYTTIFITRVESVFICNSLLFFN
jgi:hypothetical protein